MNLLSKPNPKAMSKNMFSVSPITQSAQRICKNGSRTSLENIFSEILFALGGTRDIRAEEDGTHLGSKAMRKTCFEVSPSSRNEQGMCRNDARTSLGKVIFLDFLKFFIIFGLRFGPDPGIF